MSKFISAFEFAKKHNTSKQNVYRWIREGKIKAENIKKEVMTVERIRINEDVKL